MIGDRHISGTSIVKTKTMTYHEIIRLFDSWIKPSWSILIVIKRLLLYYYYFFLKGLDKSPAAA